MKNFSIGNVEEGYMIMSFWKKIYSFERYMMRFYTENPLFPFIITLIIVVPIVFFLSKGYYYGDGKTDDLVKSLLAEAHGMLFDIFIFGIIITLINISRNRKQEIKRYKEEIEDYRGWKEAQASYRLAGIIRRLSERGENDLVLFDCYLTEAKLANVNLEGSVLSFANLGRAQLDRANLKGAHLAGANLGNTYFRKANLENTNLEGANLNGAYFESANLNGARVDLYQFKQVKSLEKAIMPDGSIYDKNWAKKISESKQPEESKA